MTEWLPQPQWLEARWRLLFLLLYNGCKNFSVYWLLYRIGSKVCGRTIKISSRKTSAVYFCEIRRKDSAKG
nr:MAG TPA: hypothetical protein [Caudoviricetes sp.]